MCVTDRVLPGREPIGPRRQQRQTGSGSRSQTWDTAGYLQILVPPVAKRYAGQTDPGQESRFRISGNHLDPGLTVEKALLEAWAHGVCHATPTRNAVSS